MNTLNVAVTKDVGYGDGLSANDSLNKLKNLTEGSIAFFDEQGVFIPVNTGALVIPSGLKEFYVGYNNAGIIYKTKPVSLDRILNFEKKDYVAPVMASVVVGKTGTNSTGIEAAEEGHCGIKVIDTTFAQTHPKAVNYATVYKKANMSVADVMTKLTEKLNASTSLPVTATLSGTGANRKITIVSKERGQVLEIATDGLMDDAYREDKDDSVAGVVRPVVGVGVPEDVAEEEKEATIFQGNNLYQRFNDKMFNFQSGVVSTEEYNMITFSEATKDRPGDFNIKQNVLIAKPSSDANGQGALIDSFFNSVL